MLNEKNKIGGILMKRQKDKKKKKGILKKLPIAILAGGLIGIGLFPFHKIKSKLTKKTKKKKRALA